MLIMIIGPTNSGKSDLIKELKSTYNVEDIIQYTTKPQRKEEIDTIDAIFMYDPEFNYMLEKDTFIGYRAFNIVGIEYQWRYAYNKKDFLNINKDTIKIMVGHPQLVVELLKNEEFIKEGLKVYVTQKFSKTTLVKRGSKKGDSQRYTRKRLEIYENDFEVMSRYLLDNKIEDIFITKPKMNSLIKRYVKESKN